MDKIARIRQEIERLKGICTAQIKANPGQTFPFVMEMTGYDKLLSFLDTLSEEPDKSLEEEMEKFGERWPYPASFDGYDKDWVDELTEECAKHFYELGQSQMPMPEDTVLFQKGVAEGRRLEREEKDLGWISVKDRLPEKNGWYFTCVEQFKIPQCVGITYFDKEDGLWLNDIPMGKKSFMTTIEIVDYWMEIPKLPEEE